MRRKWYGEIRTLFVIESGDDAIALSTGGGRSKTDRSGLTQPVADSLITLDTAVTTLDTSRGHSKTMKFLYKYRRNGIMKSVHKNRSHR